MDIHINYRWKQLRRCRRQVIAYIRVSRTLPIRGEPSHRQPARASVERRSGNWGRARIDMGDMIWFVPIPESFTRWLISTYPCVLDFRVSCLPTGR